MSKLSEYIYKKMLGQPDALPFHLRNYNGTGRVKLHNDWFGPMKFIPRSWNAYGPRPSKSSKGYLAWPPRLSEGVGVARWENSGASSILYIPNLADDKVRKGGDVYGRTFSCVETNPGHPDYGQEGTAELKWSEAMVVELPESGGRREVVVSPNDYSPSAIQCFSRHGYVELSPSYKSWWKAFKYDEKGVTAAFQWTKAVFYRQGHRPDHLDVYYNVDKLLPIGFIGLQGE